MTTETPTAQDITGNPAMKAKRKKLFAILGGVTAVCVIAYGSYWYMHASNFISTDNAYTATEVAQITPAINGNVKEVKVVDTQTVAAGDPLVIIDDTDAKLDVAQAEAEAQRAVAQLAVAQSELTRAQIELKRREALVTSGSVSGDELTRAQNAATSAQATSQSAQADVARTRAKLEQAKTDLARTVIRAPVAGVVARRSVQVGQRIQAGAQLLSIVPIQEMHVDANFKEVQLERVRPGQKVELTADLYGDTVHYQGVVEGFSGGTGAAFALIPAQNATGNWIKVVQRVPVRIRLDANQLKAHPLQLGLSMNATIDLRDNSR